MNNKGFTLIELIIVIAILGILSAVAVPKFFSLTDRAHNANAEAIAGAVKSGLALYRANDLASGGTGVYPAGGTIASDATTILDDVPKGWTCSAGGTGEAVFSYTAKALDFTYTSSGATSYSLATGGTNNPLTDI